MLGREMERVGVRVEDGVGQNGTAQEVLEAAQEGYVKGEEMVPETPTKKQRMTEGNGGVPITHIGISSLLIE